jgi:hypothetical protein
LERLPVDLARFPRPIAVLLALVAAFGLSCVRSSRCAAAEELSTDERVAYWIDRLVKGPEPTTFALPHIHQALLMDAERNLIAAPEAALAHLVDEKFRARIEEQHDINPLLAILGVLERIGARRPEVARAWAGPAILHDELLVRRAGLAVLASINDRADGPRFVELVRRNAADRTITPVAIKALLALGPPWDGEAARVVFEYGVADQAGGKSSAWEGIVPAAEESPGGARDDLIAWWAVLAESAGPHFYRARVKGPRGGSEPTFVLPLGHGFTSGRESAKYARAVLASRGHTIAHQVVAPSDAERAATRDAARALVARLVAHDPKADPKAGSVAIAAIVSSLRDDLDPSVVEILQAILRAIPPDPAWKEGLFVTFDALSARSVEPIDFVEALLRSGDPSRVDLALALIRRAKDILYLDPLDRWMDDPVATPFRRAARRELVYLFSLATTAGRVAPDRVAAFARKLVGWVADPADASGRGLASALLELGPAGEAEFVRGLSGPDRSAYVEALAGTTDRYVSVDVVTALLNGITNKTPEAVRQDLWTAVFLVSPTESAPAIEAAMNRLSSPASDEAATLLSIVRHRVAIGR